MWNSLNIIAFDTENTMVLENSNTSDQNAWISTTKTIGNYGSYVYLFNQIMNPSIFMLPMVMKQAGFVSCLFINAIFCISGALCSTFLMKAMVSLPGNEFLQKRYEFISLVELTLGNLAKKIFAVCFYGSLQSINIVGIIVVAQAFDRILVQSIGKSGVLGFYPKFMARWVSNDIDKYYDGSYGNFMGITVGFLLCCTFSMPPSFQNLEENMFVQHLSFLAQIFQVLDLIIIGFLRNANVVKIAMPSVNASSVTFFKKFQNFYPNLHVSTLNAMKLSANTNVSDISGIWTFGQHQFIQLCSIYFFAYAYSVLLPSWVNEMKSNVKASNVVWISSVMSAIMYVFFGLALAIGYPENKLDSIVEAVLLSNIGPVQRIALYITIILNTASGNILNSILIRYNILNSKSMGVAKANFFAVVFPYLIGWAFLSNRYFTAFISLSTLLLTVPCNFIFPILVFLKTRNASNLTSISNSCEDVEMATKTPFVSAPTQGLNITIGPFGTLPNPGKLLPMTVLGIIFVSTLLNLILIPLQIWSV